jgi:hypothetical protein
MINNIDSDGNPKILSIDDLNRIFKEAMDNGENKESVVIWGLLTGPYIRGNDYNTKYANIINALKCDYSSTDSIEVINHYNSICLKLKLPDIFNDDIILRTVLEHIKNQLDTIPTNKSKIINDELKKLKTKGIPNIGLLYDIVLPKNSSISAEDLFYYLYNASNDKANAIEMLSKRVNIAKKICELNELMYTPNQQQGANTSANDLEMVNKILDKENQNKEENAVSDIENSNNSESFDMLKFSQKKFAKTSGNISECSQAAEGPADIK